MNVLQPVIGTISYILNLHYELVTFLVTSTYDAAITTVFVLQTISLSLEQARQAAATLLLDAFGVFVHLGKVVVWFIAWLAILLENALLMLESFLYNVYLWMVGAGSALLSVVTTILNYLLWLIKLPYFCLLSVNNHMLWCYTEICQVVHALSTVTIELITNLLYHVLLTPYYIISYTCQMVSALATVLRRLGHNLLYIMGDSFHKMKYFSRNITAKVSSVVGSVSNTYITSVQLVFSDVFFYIWRFFVWIFVVIDEVYFADVQLVFGERATLTNLIYSICRLPFKTASTFVKDILVCIRELVYISVELRERIAPINYPLPNIPRDIYCVFEELIWLLWLTILTNWQEIFMLAILITGVFLITKQHNLVIRRGQLAGRRGEADLAVEDLLDMEDETGPVTIQVPRSRAQREARSRSRTPDLSTPGAETRYLHKLKRTLDEEVNNRRCVVCQHYTRNILLIPCKHVCLCTDCVQGVLRRHPPTCPLCRMRINQVIDVYL